MREKNIKVILAEHNPYITLLTLMNFQSTDWKIPIPITKITIPSYQKEVNHFEMFAKWTALRLFA